VFNDIENKLRIATSTTPRTACRCVEIINELRKTGTSDIIFPGEDGQPLSSMNPARELPLG
jgi:hypothetical protein